MHTKPAEPLLSRGRSRAPGLPAGPSVPDTVAYWLEDDLGHRVTRRYHEARTPLTFAGRALEHVGNLDGWSLVRLDVHGVRHVVAAARELADLATPFLPKRTAEETAALAPFISAIRRVTERDPDPEITDERVY